MTSDGNGNGGRLLREWPVFVSTLTLIGLAFGAFWSIEQVQLNNINDTIKTLKEETASRRDEIKGDIKEMQKELRALHNEFIDVGDHVEFAKRLDGRIDFLESQLTSLEATRPTTGELKATADGLRVQVDGLQSALGGVATKADVAAEFAGLRDRIDQLYRLTLPSAVRNGPH